MMMGQVAHRVKKAEKNIMLVFLNKFKLFLLILRVPSCNIMFLEGFGSISSKWKNMALFSLFSIILFYRLQGEPVNLREQHDACEFYNILVESINEALKALGEPQILNKILGGSFSDQKICKTCPHRYSREEAFTVISIDIRNYSNLHDSLEQYVKGDLLEGDNAYLCEKCDKKVRNISLVLRVCG